MPARNRREESVGIYGQSRNVEERESRPSGLILDPGLEQFRPGCPLRSVAVTEELWGPELRPESTGSIVCTRPRGPPAHPCE